MSHPEPHGPPDRNPIKVGEIWENPVTRERVTILERPCPEAVDFRLKDKSRVIERLGNAQQAHRVYAHILSVCQAAAGQCPSAVETCGS
jgi:hypothetical protein